MRPTPPAGTKTKKRPASRSPRTASGRPIQYRLPKPTEIEPPQQIVEEAVDLSDDYTPMVRGVLRASSTLFLSQSLSAILIANQLGAELQIKFHFKVLPYVAILAQRTTFVSIVTWSTAFAAIITCLIVLSGLVRHRDERKLLDGWSTGLFMAGLLVIFQYLRHLLDPPVIDGWILAQTAAGIVAATVIYLGFKPGGAPSASAEQSTALASARRSGSTTQPRNNNRKIKEETK